MYSRNSRTESTVGRPLIQPRAANRRIGRNELAVMQVVLAVVDAQREYAARDWDGDGVKSYAMRAASSPGKRDGLYWASLPDAELLQRVGDGRRRRLRLFCGFHSLVSLGRFIGTQPEIRGTQNQQESAEEAMARHVRYS